MLCTVVRTSRYVLCIHPACFLPMSRADGFGNLCCSLRKLTIGTLPPVPGNLLPVAGTPQKSCAAAEHIQGYSMCTFSEAVGPIKPQMLSVPQTLQCHSQVRTGRTSAPSVNYRGSTVTCPHTYICLCLCVLGTVDYLTAQPRQCVLRASSPDTCMERYILDKAATVMKSHANQSTALPWVAWKGS